MKVSISALCLLMSSLSFAQSNQNEIVEVSKTREIMSYDINIYPNPSDKDIHIAAPEGAICKVFSSKGVYVGTWEIRENGLDLLGMPSGNYIVTIQQGSQKISKRFLIL